MRNRFHLCLIIITVTCTTVLGQTKPDDLNIFGYFQVSFMQFSEQDFKTNFPEVIESEWLPPQNTFSIQHLNLFLSKNISDHWRAFINFEFTNSFSSYKNWGAFNLEEVWIRYKPSDEFGTQAGLLIPTFNNLNEIKNRTPLLPYIFRPFVYETSLKDFFFFIEDFVPSRAWLQVSGTFKHRDIKFDYAFYTGNSPNISESGVYAPSGYDTTNTFLFGGRFGLRWLDLKAGISLTSDKKNSFMDYNTYDFKFNRMPRHRLGVDFSLQVGTVYIESEFIQLMQDEDYLTVLRDGEPVNDVTREFSFDGKFYYGMLLLNATKELDLYISYSAAEIYFPWVAAVNPTVTIYDTRGKLSIPTVGAAWHINDSVILKAQYLKMDIEEHTRLYSAVPVEVEQDRSILMLAGSVFF